MSLKYQDIEEKVYTVEEYLTMEEKAEYKSEYRHGKIVAMSGGTLNHSLISSNMNTQIGIILEDKISTCNYFNSDAKIHIESANSFVYSDGLLVCGEIETAEQDKNSIINPVLVIEVLSDSTEKYDRGDKFHKYCSLPSFKEYILIDQRKPVIDSLYRSNEGYWKMVTTIDLDKELYINTLDHNIPMNKIYRNAQRLEQPQFKMQF